MSGKRKSITRPHKQDFTHKRLLVGKYDFFPV
jgi:hypothetical protein